MTSPAWLAVGPDAVFVRVRVQPRTRSAGVVATAGERLRLRVAAPPVDGRANAEAIALVARLAGVARTAVAVSHGAAHRDKTLRVSTRDPAVVAVRLAVAATPCASGGRVLE